MRLISSVNIDRILFLYGCLITVSLLSSAIANPNGMTNVTSFVLFLPIALYFFSEVHQSINHHFHALINYGQPGEHRYFAHFSLKTFFDQVDYTFLVTLILLALAVCITFIRYSLKILE